MSFKAEERLIVALDVPDGLMAKQLVTNLGDSVVFYKVGLELMMSGDYFSLIEWLKSKGKKVFTDLKLYDISETIARSVKNLARYETDLLTIHSASRGIMEKAAENKGKMKVVGVTVLTNIDSKDLSEMGFDPKISLENLVKKKTALALDSGLDGVVASGLEAKDLRENFGKDFLIVTPGVRMELMAKDDQKRICDVKTALTNGSSYLVVGRPITRDADPKAAAQHFNAIIHETLANSFAT